MVFKAVNDDDDDEVKGDMTPMIDIIFLLLIFFILTTKFIPEEKVIANLLPTDKGTAQSSAPVVETEEIKIKIIPGIFQSRLSQPSEYQAAWEQSRHTSSAIYQVGNQDFIVVEGKDFKTRGGSELSQALDQVHGYLHGHLAKYEGPGARKDLAPVIIMGFTGMQWKYVLAAFDAIRAWENQHSRAGQGVDALLNARDVQFAPPRVRNFAKNEMGKELWEIHYAK